jgi:Uma2 family endonuclease
MATAQLISVEAYLHTSFEYDAEYVEGRIVQRPLPQRRHSMMQSWLNRTLHTAGRQFGYRVWVEQRIRTQRQPARFRIPDLCVTLGDPGIEVFTAPPFLCVEVLSPDESGSELQNKVREYLSFGVSYIWVIDPATNSGEIHTSDGTEGIDNGRFTAGALKVDLKDID